MPVVFNDYLLIGAGNVGKFIQAVNNSTSVAYFSPAATDPNGRFALAGNPPPGYYTTFTSPTGSPPWTATGDVAFFVGPDSTDTLTVAALKAAKVVPTGSPFSVRKSDDSTDVLLTYDTGQIGARFQIYPGDQAGGQQVIGGLLHSTGVPSNANGNNKDWCHSDNGIMYFKAAGVWSATTGGGGGVNIDTTPGDYVPIGDTFVLGSTGKAADAGTQFAHPTNLNPDAHHNRTHSDVVDHSGPNKVGVGDAASAGATFNIRNSGIGRPNMAFLTSSGSLLGLVTDDAPNLKADVLLETFDDLVRPAAAVQEGPLKLINTNSQTQALLTIKQLQLFLVYLPLGRVINSISFLSGTTPANTPVNQWAAIYTTAGNLVAQTTDLGAAAWAASSVQTFSFGAAQTVVTGAPWTGAGLYYIALMVNATAVPTLSGGALAVSASKIGAAGGLNSPGVLLGAAFGTAPATTTIGVGQGGYPFFYFS